MLNLSAYLVRWFKQRGPDVVSPEYLLARAVYLQKAIRSAYRFYSPQLLHWVEGTDTSVNYIERLNDDETRRAYFRSLGEEVCLTTHKARYDFATWIQMQYIRQEL